MEYTETEREFLVRLWGNIIAVQQNKLAMFRMNVGTDMIPALMHYLYYINDNAGYIEQSLIIHIVHNPANLGAMSQWTYIDEEDATLRLYDVNKAKHRHVPYIEYGSV